MDAMLQNKELSLVQKLGKLLQDHNGIDVLAMDMRPLDFWTDFFVITTVTSSTHMEGMERHIKEFVKENKLEILYRSSRPNKNSMPNLSEQDLTEIGPDEWRLLDLGGIVIHLMTSKSRSFYELERLWSSAPLVSIEAGHSSKSS